MSNLEQDIEALGKFLQINSRLVVLSGAGISASSGIPTYRDTEGKWQHREPIKHQEFMLDPAKRRRYWARSLLGWPPVRDARPNDAHLALAELERLGGIELVITQNVDRLHQRAGSHKVIDLHGRLDRVRCLDCSAVHSRERVQRQLHHNNRRAASASAGRRPDGDWELADDDVRQIQVPVCEVCGGALIPDVVFFGGSVPKERVQTGMVALEQADAILAVGSSLQVYSGFRFCRRARALGKPLAIINPGDTRADDLAQLKLESDCGPLLKSVIASPTTVLGTLPFRSYE